MQYFIDLQGASGASYRFRRLRNAPHTCRLRELCLLVLTNRSFKVLTVGRSIDLSANTPPGSRGWRKPVHLSPGMNIALTFRDTSTRTW